MKNLNDVYFEDRQPYIKPEKWNRIVQLTKKDLEEYGNIIRIVDEVYPSQKGVFKRYYQREKLDNYVPFPNGYKGKEYEEHSFILDSRRVGLAEEGLPFERKYDVVFLDE